MIEATRGVLDPVRFGTWAKPAARSKVRTPGWSWASVNVILMRRPGKNPPGVPVAALDYIVESPVIDGRRAQLPEAVARWAVEPFVLDHGFALDPFAGTGQLLKPAAAAGMAALGFDQDAAVSLTAPPCLCGHTFSAHQHPSEFSSCPCGCCESDAHEGAAWLYGPQIDLEEQRGP